MKTRTRFALSCAALLLVCPAATPSVGTRAQYHHRERVPAQCGDALEVLFAIDGDTIVVRRGGEHVTVRLLGIDSPETKDPRRPVQPGGRSAARFLRRLVAHECVTLESGSAEAMDSYGRTLAYVVRARDGLFVNLEMVATGYARATRRWPHRFLDLFTRAERDARSAGLGIWSTRYDRGRDVMYFETAPSTSGYPTICSFE